MKSSGWMHLLTCALALVALPAFAEADVFGLGAGRDETLTVQAHESRVINSYAAVTSPLSKGDHELQVDAPEGFVAGDLVMVLQTLGVGPVRSSSVATFTFGPREQSPGGVWELARVARVRGAVLTLTRPVLNDFVPLSTQVIRVPEYTSVTIHPTGELKARSWNGTSGGVVAFLASGTLHNGGIITASGALLRQQPLGDGGVVFFRARKLTGAGRIEANGQALPWDLGTEGGGEGGSISARLVESAECEALMAQGGPGVPAESFGAQEGFGPGAGGKVLLQAGSLTGCPVRVTGGESVSGDVGTSVGEPGDVTLVEHALIIPRTPVITTPGDGQALTAPTPVVTGTGDPGATVFLRMGNIERPATPEWEFPATPVGDAGDFSVRVPTDLDDGVYSLTAHAEFEGLSSLSSDPVYFTVEAFAPPLAPVILTPTEGELVGTGGTDFSGTAEPDSRVDLLLDGVPYATIDASPAGEWSFLPSTPLTEGARTLTATATDADDNTSPVAERHFTVDTTPPLAPVIETPIDAARVGSAGTGFSGTAENSSTVTVLVDGLLIGTATAHTTTGAWSLPNNTSLAEGSRTMTVTAKDATGNTSPAAQRTFSVDKTPPVAPVIQTPINAARVGSAGTDFSGTAENSSTVTVLVDGLLIGTATAHTTTGAWSLPNNTSLAEGSRTMTVTAKDAAGNTSPTAQRTFTVDKTPPAVPVIQTPASGAVVGATGTNFSGTAENSSTVTVHLDGNFVGTATAHATTGAWTVPASSSQGAGPHTVTATATDAAGNISSTAENAFTVDAAAPDAPVIQTPASGAAVGTAGTGFSGTAENSSTVTVLVDGLLIGTATAHTTTGAWSLPNNTSLAEGSRTMTVTAEDAAGNTSPAAQRTFTVDKTPPAVPVIQTPAASTVVGATGTDFSGTAEANSIVTVLVDGLLIGTATAHATTGVWSLPTNTSLAEGSRTMTVTAEDAAGNTSPAAQRTFTVDKTPPAVPVIQTPASGAVVGAAGTDFSGTAEANSIVTVHVDGAFVGTTTAHATTGAWTVPASSSLDEGPHTVTATATDGVGNISPTAENAFAVDAAGPVVPLIQTPVAGTVVGSAGTTFSGTAENSSTVTVLVDGLLIGTTTAHATTGAWSLPNNTSLAEGSHTMTVTAKDAAGNTSPTAQRTFAVDKTPPAVPVIQTPASGAVVGTAGTGFSGTAEANSIVTVRVGTTVVGTPQATGTGAWSVPTQTGFTHGSYTVTVTATDAGNNVGPAATRTFTVDTAAPSAPVILTPNPDTVVGPAGTGFSGTAEANSTVSVSVDGVPIGNAQASGPGGAWSLPVSTGFANGTRTVSATATDAANNTSLPTAISFVVDVTPPAAPVIQTPNPLTVVGTAGTGFSGTAENVSTVTVRVDGAPVGTTQAGPSGNWLLAPQAGFTHGTHTVTAIATDALGNTSSTAESTFTVDIAAPAAPVIQTPAEGAVIGPAGTSFSGTAENLSMVNVYVDGQSVGGIQASGTGTWSLPVRTGFTNGAHTVTATATDAANNISATASHGIVVDIIAPSAPVIQVPTEGAVVGPVGTGISGTAEANSTVKVSVDGAAHGTVQANGLGAWSLPVSTTFTHGPHTVTATTTDVQGNTSVVAERHFSVDIEAPTAPVIQTPNSTTVVGPAGTGFSGTAEADSTVKVSVDGAPVGTAQANTSGAWSLPTQGGFTDGAHTVTATATDASNNTSATATSTFTVDLTAPAAPVIQTPNPDTVVGAAGTAFSGTAERLSTVRVSVDGGLIASPQTTAEGTWSIAIRTGFGAGSHTVTAIATDALNNTSTTATSTFTVDLTPPAAPVILTPTVDIVVGEDGTGFSGTAEPRSSVRVLVDGDLVGTAVVNGGGNWSLPTLVEYPHGTHLVTATATDPANNTSAPAEVRFTVDVTDPSAPTILKPTTGTLVNANGTAFEGTAEPLSTVKLLINEAVFVTAVTNINGQWAVPVSTTLGDGPHTVTATATDVAKNESAPSVAIQITVDASRPAIPILTSPAADAVVGKARPDFIGTTEAGAKVSIFIDGALAGAVTASSTGAWTFAPVAGLSQARHDVQVQATDLAGNTGDPSSSRSFRVDTTPPTTVVSVPAQNATLTTPTPRIEGTAEADSTIFITLDGTTLPGVTVDGAGNWFYVPPQGLANGRHDMLVQAMDLAGNEGPRITRAFTLDLEPPGKPELRTPTNAALVNSPTPLIVGTAPQQCVLTVRLDGLPQDQHPVIASTGEWKFTPSAALSDGLHLVNAYCTDAFKRTGPDSTTHAFTVDTSKPAPPVVLTPAVDAIVRPDNYTITGTSEPGTTLTATLNGLTVGTTLANERGEWTVAVTLAIVTGLQDLRVFATDMAGNIGDKSTPRTFTVDSLPPTTTLSGGPTGTSTLSEVTFTLNTSEPVSGFKCTLDGVELSPCENPLTVRSLSEGIHSLDVLATDIAGNVQITPAHHQWNVIRPSLVEGGGVGCSSTAGALPLGLVWLAWVGLLGLRRRR
ncbi:hypothetical protein HUA74_14690 [Myxococcus sp. CA051A]|uniref:Ig-like domain-containing protein n=2 Tax=unclassified Myxococcus TaxID=2648731 RepID=UPI00157AC8AF|nr:Ig-like domain-containing protein [Myxococcus sp. CA051A]NTX61907.1 hypothetical protein [Myxococcus sp. CA051A]